MSALAGPAWVLSIAVLVWLALAVVPALHARSWQPLRPALGRVFLLVIVPLPIFLLSVFLSPHDKRSCALGWVDCFFATKLWLTPLVLWAVAAMYERDILGRTRSPPAWVWAGLVWGVSVSGACLLHFALLMFVHTNGHPAGIFAFGGFLLFLLVPCYVHAWFLWRLRALWLRARPPLVRFLALLAVGLPCWVAAIVHARRLYAGLPETSGCFVVTAASRGHPGLVGSPQPVLHAGQVRRATQQLATFWALEAAWQRRSPASHAIFRRFYNRVGPRVARRIRHPWQADLVFLLLKPLECFARPLLQIQARNFQSLELRPWRISNDWKSS